MLNSLLEKGSIKSKFNVVVLLPFTIITLILGYLIWQNVKEYQQQKAVQARLVQVKVLASVAHNFAVERGLTAGFLARKGANAEPLINQHKNADQAAQALIAILPELKISAHQDEIKLLTELEMALAQRDSLRQGVLQLVPPFLPFDYYSNINTNALTVLEQVMVSLNDPKASQIFNAYLSLSWLKEKAGQERGALNGVFTTNELPLEKAVTIESYLAQQAYFQQRLIHFSSEAFHDVFIRLLQEDTMKNVQNMRAVFIKILGLKQRYNQLLELLDTKNSTGIEVFKAQLASSADSLDTAELTVLQQLISAIEQAQTTDEKQTVFADIVRYKAQFNPLGTVQASDWFGAATERISLINRLAIEKSEELAALVNSKAQYLFWVSIIELLFGIVLLAVLFIISRAISNKMVQDLGVINKSISDVSNLFSFKAQATVTGQDEIATTATMFNRMLVKLDAAISESVQVSDAIASGNFTKRIEGDFVGDLALLKQGINRSALSVASTMSSLEIVVDGLADGRLDVRLPQEVKGQLREKVNFAMSQTEQALEQIERSVSSISQGDFSKQINVPLKGTLQTVKLSINSALENINSTVTAIADAMSAVEKGDFSAHVSGDYKGTFAQLQQSINQSVKVNQQALSAIKQTFTHLANGEFKTMEVAKLQGDFVLLGKEINHTISQYQQTFAEILAASNQLAEGQLSVRVSEHYPGELGKLSKALNRSTYQLDEGVANINAVMKHASAGDFSHQITAQLGGDLATLKSNMNKMLKDTEGAVGDIASVVQKLSQGQLTDPISVHYDGMFGQLKDDTNYTIEKLKRFIEGDLAFIIEAAQAGKLDQRIELTGKKGFYLQISEGVNLIVARCADVIDDCQHVMERLAKSDLTPRIERDYQGSFNDLKRNTNASLDHLCSVVDKIKAASLVNLTGIDEISKGNTSLSQRTEEQAASLEEINATMSEITEMVSGSAEQAKLVESRMQATCETAELGGTVVERAIASMTEINQASKSIEDIISVIDEIAFQTNLLALNAAVESARAGDSGRGFAVVAAEVRNLAQRSASSAKKISQLIAETVAKVEQGSLLVEESGTTLRQIISLIRQAANSATQIATESVDQQQRVQETKAAIEQLDNVTQSNSSLVEQIASASQNLASQSQDTLSLLEAFRLAGQTQGRHGTLLLPG